MRKYDFLILTCIAHHPPKFFSFLTSDKTVVVSEPRAVFLCVHQLMVALFGSGKARSSSNSRSATNR